MRDKYTLEDIINAQVKDALSELTAPANPAPVQAPAGGSAGGMSLDINGITKLLGEINKLAGTIQSRGASGGGLSSDGLPVAGSSPMLPVAGGAGNNPRPGAGEGEQQTHKGGEAAMVSKLDPEKLYEGIYDTIGRLRAQLGDVKLSELETFMADNRAVVVVLIGQELEKWMGQE